MLVESPRLLSNLLRMIGIAEVSKKGQFFVVVVVCLFCLFGEDLNRKVFSLLFRSVTLLCVIPFLCLILSHINCCCLQMVFLV